VLLLQSPIHYYDELPAGDLVLQTLNLLREYSSGPHASMR